MSNSGALAQGLNEQRGTELDQIWFHTKSKGLYRVLTADARYEGVEDSRAVVYQSFQDQSVWIRPYSEFMDGRFVRVLGIIAAHNALVAEIDDLNYQLNKYIGIYGGLE